MKMKPGSTNSCWISFFETWIFYILEEITCYYNNLLAAYREIYLTGCLLYRFGWHTFFYLFGFSIDFTVEGQMAEQQFAYLKIFCYCCFFLHILFPILCCCMLQFKSEKSFYLKKKKEKKWKNKQTKNNNKN